MAETLNRIEEMLARLTSDLQAAYMMPGPNKPEPVAMVCASIESLANARAAIIAAGKVRS